MLNALSAVLELAVALKVNEEVVCAPTSVGSPEIAPVDEFKDNPSGKEPD